MPTGQELTKIAIAVAISRPANQSVTIFDMETFRSTPPIPDRIRPTSWAAHDSPSVIRTPPATMRQRPLTTTRRSPKRRPNEPPGIASAIPGAR